MTMNAKSILVLCFLIGASFTMASGQEKSNRALQGWVEGSYWSPVYCDGVMVDELSGGHLEIHYVFKTFKNGRVLAMEVDRLKGTVESVSGEIFEIREVDKYVKVDHWVVTWHYNLLGDQGSHYTGWITYDYLTEEITVGHTTCN